MDNKPQIDLERLKEIQTERKKKTDPTVVETADQSYQWVLTEKDGWVKRKPDPSLSDPYFQRRHIVDLRDFDEWS